MGLSVEAGLLGPLGKEVGELWATFSIFGVGAALTFLLMLFFSPHCGQVMKTMYERSGLAKLIIHDTTSGSTTTYYKVIDAKTNIATTKIVVSPIFGH